MLNIVDGAHAVLTLDSVAVHKGKMTVCQRLGFLFAMHSPVTDHDDEYLGKTFRKRILIYQDFELTAVIITLRRKTTEQSDISNLPCSDILQLMYSDSINILGQFWQLISIAQATSLLNSSWQNRNFFRINKKSGITGTLIKAYVSFQNNKCREKDEG